MSSPGNERLTKIYSAMHTCDSSGRKHSGVVDQVAAVMSFQNVWEREYHVHMRPNEAIFPHHRKGQEE